MFTSYVHFRRAVSDVHFYSLHFIIQPLMLRYSRLIFLSSDISPLRPPTPPDSCTAKDRRRTIKSDRWCDWRIASNRQGWRSWSGACIPCMPPSHLSPTGSYGRTPYPSIGGGHPPVLPPADGVQEWRSPIVVSRSIRDPDARLYTPWCSYKPSLRRATHLDHTAPPTPHRRGVQTLLESIERLSDQIFDRRA